MFACICVIVSSCVIILCKTNICPESGPEIQCCAVDFKITPLYVIVVHHCSLFLTYRWAHLQSFTRQPCLDPRLRPEASQWQNSIQQQHQKLSTSRKLVKKPSECVAENKTILTICFNNEGSWHQNILI